MLDRIDASGNRASAVLHERDRAALASQQAYGFNPIREEEDAFSPVRLLLYVLQYRWLIAILISVGLVLGVVITLMQTPKYQATARIEIMVPTARILEDMDVVAQSSDMRTFETARERLVSRDLARRVVLDRGLSQNVDFLFPPQDFSLGNIFSRVFGQSPRGTLDDLSAEAREARAVGTVLSNLSVSLVRGTSLLAVSYASQDRELASVVANQVVRSYMDQQVDRTVETSDLARQFIEEQVGEVKSRLEASERNLVAYVRDTDISTTGENGSLVSNNIRAINDSLASAIQTRLTQERLVQQIENGMGGQLEEVLNNNTIQDLRGRLAVLRADYQQKLSVYKPDFPDMLQLGAQIAEVEQQIAEGVATISLSIRLRHEETVRAEEDLRTKLAELEIEQRDFLDKNIEYTILQREVESNRAQYDSLIGKLNDLAVVADLRRVNIDVVDFATPPGAPFSPSLSRNLMMFVGAFAALAGAIIYIVELFNNKFSVPDQVERELGLPVLGMIPLVEAEGVKEALSDPASSLSEAYRTLRTSLQFTGTEGAPRHLLVSSTEPNEAKSTTVLKLAAEFGALGVKVLVIDADLRRPSLHRVYKTDNTFGLSNLLTNTVNEDEAKRLFRKTGDANVTFLASGPLVPNPADLLSSHRMPKIIDAALKPYDMVIIDGPPVIGLSDSLILSRLAEATLLVVSAHQVQRKAAKRALARLHSIGAHVVGVTLTKLDMKRMQYSYGYGYGYSYYDGYYAYGSEQRRLSGNEADEPEGAIANGKTRHALGGVFDRYLRPLAKWGRAPAGRDAA